MRRSISKSYVKIIARLERVSQINIGERITKVLNVKKNLEKDIGGSLESTMLFKESEKNHINLTYFTTFVGTIGVMISLNQKVYDFLYHLQGELQKTLAMNKNSSLNLSLDYQKWRAVKVNYIYLIHLLPIKFTKLLLLNHYVFNYLCL